MSGLPLRSRERLCLFGGGVVRVVPAAVSRSHGWQIDHEGSPSFQEPEPPEECTSSMTTVTLDTECNVNVCIGRV